MANVEIYWHQYDSGNYLTSSLSIDGLGFEPEPVIKNANKDAIYYECPAWSHKAKRTFILRCPVDIHLNINYPNVTSPNLNEKQLQDWISRSFRDSRWFSLNLTTLQFSIPGFLFWTKKKNVWFEIRSHAMTSVNNNFVTIPGWWCLSNWTRPTSFALDVVNINKPIIIKRGDPICEVCFYTDDFNDTIKLVKKIPEESMLTEVIKRLRVKRYVKHALDKLLFKKEIKTCPFSFLWKNTPQDKG